ncbi:MAG: hypothetical protein J6X02_03120 [Bacilli bacterium]|nr:hypothetical protein [Bacilli bacterium]
MNNKGFTTVEVIVSFSLVVIIMASMTTMLVAYRDTINVEETKSKMIEFKNTFTYMVYQDIVTYNLKGIQPCDGTDPANNTGNLCVKFISETDPGEYTLILEPDVPTLGSEGEEQRRVYLNYRGIRMMLPDSDLNKVIKEKNASGVVNVVGEKTTSTIHDFVLQKDELNGVYSLIIPIEHKGIDYVDNIRIVVAN